MSLRLKLIIAALLLSANAQAKTVLSPNPWVEPNDKETINEIYQKNQQKNNQAAASYVPETSVEIDVSRKIQKTTRNVAAPQKQNSGMISKIKNMFTKEPEATPPQKAAQLPPQKLSPQSQQNRSDNIYEDRDIFGLKKTTNNIKNNLNRALAQTRNLANKTLRSAKASLNNLSRQLKH